VGRSHKWFLNEVKFAPVKNGYTARKERQRRNSARVKKSANINKMIDRRQKTPTVASLNLNFAKKSGYAFDSSEIGRAHV
jgi:hypothetical protein